MIPNSLVPVRSELALKRSLGLNLTVVAKDQVPSGIRLELARFIAYSQRAGHTRLTLTGGKILDVLEATWQIDQLIRAAAAESRPVVLTPRNPI